MFYLHLSPIAAHVEDLDFVEMFGGTKELSSAMASRGWRAGTYDRKDDPVNQDFCTDAGFLKAAAQLRRVRSGGLVHWSPPVAT